MLMLKIVRDDMTAYNDFVWPKSGPVECPDWNPKAVCGGGLHGWANGQGTYRHSYNSGMFLVVEADDGAAVTIDGEKVKIPRGNVVYCGNREGAVKYLVEHGALTKESDSAWVCLTPSQLVTVAMRAADRAVRTYASRSLRARGFEDQAKTLESLAPIVDKHAAANAADAADAAANYAAADAANAAYYADAAANYDAADAADAAANYAAEREQCRKDKLEMLGLV